MDNPTFKSDTERRTFRTVFNILARFRDIDGDMPVQQMVVLAWVGLNEGKTQRDLRAALDMASSTSSRNLAALSKVHRLGKAGLGLIDWIENPEDRRAKLIYLTPKGKVFINSLVEEVA